MKKRNRIAERLASVYMTVKFSVIEAGYDSEIDWQENASFESITESYFLKEAAWVILSSGMREIVIRQKFPKISTAFFEWESAKRIVYNREKCYKKAILHFGHSKKIDAIIQVAKHVFENGFNNVCEEILKDGIQYIVKFPYMGPATSYHFAKNIGISVSKPDRHLKRIAKTVGYSCPKLMCEDIAQITGEKISVVDLILWRFATLNKNYLTYFCNSF